MRRLPRHATLVIAGLVLGVAAIACTPGGGSTAAPGGPSAAPAQSSPSPAAPQPSASDAGKGSY